MLNTLDTTETEYVVPLNAISKSRFLNSILSQHSIASWSSSQTFHH